ncbi:trypco2 family protein [Spirulina sp. 06S082]|uniref:trypco2 family protein n=1 Tax=Spirulina sp. 06S082 TaxID=3110248 RepID=UPI002B1F55EA|nr:trypco2 family protein [Spirulina sp. 06S082]MEA5467648.1 trypco2 family protein [Spirulina sp. 06S082]
MSEEIGLAELITKIKEDLAKTNKESPAFLVEKIELDLQVTVSKGREVQGSGEAKIEPQINIFSLDVLKLGEAGISGEAKASLNREDIHSIKITLTPVFLNEKLMDYLEKSDPETAKKVEESVKKINLQGSDDEFEN